MLHPYPPCSGDHINISCPDAPRRDVQPGALLQREMPAFAIKLPPLKKPGSTKAFHISLDKV